MEQNLNDVGANPQPTVSKKTSKATARKDSKWEILTSLEPGIKYNISPKPLEGFLAKRRKWPLKGWHKRYFVLDKGILTYGKSEQDINRGRTHGRIDVGLAVISAKTELMRIDIDDEEFIHHLRARDLEVFGLWLEQLQQHRLYQQNLLNEAAGSNSSGTPIDVDPVSPRSFCDTISPQSSLPRGVRPPARNSCLQEFAQMDDHMTEQLVSIQQQAVALGLLAQRLEDEVNSQLPATSGAAGKQKNLFSFRKKKLQPHQQQPTAAQTLPSPVQSASSTLRQIPDQASEVNTVHWSVLSALEGSTGAPAPFEAGNKANAAAEEQEAPGAVGAPAATRPTSMPLEAGAQQCVQTAQRASLQLMGKLSASSSSSVAGEMNSTLMSSTSTLVVGNASPSKDELITISQELQLEISNLLRNYTADRDRLKASLQDAQSQQDAVFLQQHKTATLPNAANAAGQIASLRLSLSQVLQQNMKLRARLQKIHADADVSDISPAPRGTESLMRGVVAPGVIGCPSYGMMNTGVGVNTNINQSLSYSSSCMSEFFDAREYNTDGVDDGYEYSSDDEEEGLASEEESKEKATDNEGSSEVSSEDDDDEDDDFEEVAESPPSPDRVSQTVVGCSSVASSNLGNNLDLLGPGKGSSIRRSQLARLMGTGRRVRLPAMAPNGTGLNLWNLLCKNIGKDLSKISMPVTLNEPLSLLQRLCEELEYSELLDKAVGSSHQMERMMWVAAFAVSAYGYCSDRAGHKPFNPLLGETYECVRDDKGFRYVGEQVSHHPPISACHATAENWTWWQDFRVKTKFWGKSMEFQPEGTVNVELRLKDSPWNEVYTWNKVTTCIHNLFGNAERWADLYGQCQIKCRRKPKGDDANGAERIEEKPVSSCNIEFISASGYWSSNKRHEVRGTIKDASGQVVQNIFGKCTEALYCGAAPSVRCIWRPGTLPEDNAVYYGFSRFAIELNELLPQDKDLLPVTDTRFRSDQRCLEEGKVVEAESLKLKLEQAQRERRQRAEETCDVFVPHWFRKVGAAEDDSSSQSSRCKGDEWRYTDEYWNVRKSPGFKECSLPKLW